MYVSQKHFFFSFSNISVTKLYEILDLANVFVIYLESFVTVLFIKERINISRHRFKSRGNKMEIVSFPKRGKGNGIQ